MSGRSERNPHPTIDLNADLGEGFPWDEPLLALVSSASVCCGAHAGDPDAILATLRIAGRRGVVVGAHPGYPDREGFGRRERPIGRSEVERLIREQVADLAQLARSAEVAIRFLKPHGALYNQAQRDPEIASGVVEASSSLGLPVLGLPGGSVEAEARRLGVRFVAEGFADRRYGPDGRLRPRDDPDAHLRDPQEVEAQVARLVASGVETLCLHGDDPDALARAELVLSAIRGAGVALRAFSNRACQEIVDN